jgi:hypothetical protein
MIRTLIKDLSPKPRSRLPEDLHRVRKVLPDLDIRRQRLEHQARSHEVFAFEVDPGQV